MKILSKIKLRALLLLAVAGLSMGLVAVPVAAESLKDLVAGETGVVKEVFDGDTILLDSGLRVRLVGLNAPEIAHENRPAEEFGDAARVMLRELLDGRRVQLFYGGTRRDRYDRALAQLQRDDGLWVQQAMLEQGGARVYSFADNRDLVAPMLAAEQQARKNQRGLWQLPRYAVRAADQPIKPLNVFHIVEGRVHQVKNFRQQIFINFGADWKHDFTATVEGGSRKAFAPNFLMSLEGKKIRVRGWVDYYNGPSISLNHPEQIELLENVR